MPIKSMDDLFLHTLKDIYYAERQILKALPKMAKAAHSQELREAFEQHRTETEGQIERLAQVFEMLGKPARGVKCEAIEGIIDEGQSIMEEVEDAEVRDAAMLASAQAVEHYEITRYGTLIAWARQLGHEEAAALFEQTLEEEKSTDQLLTELAEETLNQEAA